jgi:peptidyl-dipeptidase Dcp
VRTFEVKRDGKTVGLFYLDNFARAGKRSGAWMTTYRSQHKLGGKNDIVLASNNNNFVPGADGVPTLISIDDASTLFHESVFPDDITSKTSKSARNDCAAS